MTGRAHCGAAWVVRALSLLLAAGALAAVPLGERAQAADTHLAAHGGGRTYIAPFPRGSRYNLYVLGDSLGDGVWAGLYRAFRGDQKVQVVKKSRVSTGFVRSDYYDWNRVANSIVRSNSAQIAVAMFGANDRQPIRHKGKYYRVGSPGWVEAYTARVSQFMQTLREGGIALYWVGLPIMRSPRVSKDMSVLNDIYRRAALDNGVRFIETWDAFTDQSGRYSAYGPDLNGRIRKLRANDGIHFTMSGYVKLAHFVERVIRRDLNFARVERDTPLAGDETEQSQITDRFGTVRRKPRAGASSDKADEGGDQAKLADRRAARVTIVSKDGKVKAQPGAVGGEGASESAGSLPILVPAQLEEIAATPVPSRGGPTLTQVSEAVEKPVLDGLTAISSVSPRVDQNVRLVRRRPLTSTPYYRVLIKGEQLKPKQGRADDFTWPKG